MDKKPVIISASGETISALKKRFACAVVIDSYAEQLAELFLVKNPHFRFIPDHVRETKAFIDAHRKKKPLSSCGSWVYFPWNNQLVHYLPDAMHQELRTARNKNLITPHEQEKFYDFTVGIAGLSVGSHAALIIAMMGGGRVMKIADPDTISASNTNRIRTDITQIGVGKCDAVARQLYQMNPYAKISAYDRGIDHNNMEEFLVGSRKLDVLVECMDDPELKITIRIAARKHGIPVVMATDNGDGIIFDVERYDKNRELALFNGSAGDLTLEQFHKIKPQELPKLATTLAGPEMVKLRMLESVSRVGKTLYSWPQLGSAATLAGVATAYVVRRLALKLPLRSGKFEFDLDAAFDPTHNTAEGVAKREKERKRHLRAIGFKSSS